MNRFLSLIAAIFMGVFLMTTQAQAQDPENTLFLDLKNGRVVIELLPDLAPKHVTRIKQLTREGFYDGLTFHRVIEGFMAQGGDPDGTGMGGSGVNLPAEFSREPFARGVLGMARSSDINSGDSQFFIMLGAAPHLNGQYTVWGRVSEGMEFVDRIKKGSSRSNGEIDGEPDKIVRMQVAADAKD